MTDNSTVGVPPSGAPAVVGGQGDRAYEGLLDLLVSREIAPGDEFEMGDHRRHGGIEPVARGKLQGKALGKVAGKETCRIEALAKAQHAAGIGVRHTEPFGDVVEVGAHVAILVERVAEFGGDDAVLRRADRERDLLAHMLAKIRPAGREIEAVEPAVGRAGRR